VDATYAPTPLVHYVRKTLIGAHIHTMQHDGGACMCPGYAGGIRPRGAQGTSIARTVPQLDAHLSATGRSVGGRQDGLRRMRQRAVRVRS